MYHMLVAKPSLADGSDMLVAKPSLADGSDTVNSNVPMSFHMQLTLNTLYFKIPLYAAISLCHHCHCHLHS